MKRLTMALCALLLPLSNGFAADYITNAGEIVKAADWDKMKTITVEMEEHAYTPEDIVLEAGQPYKLVLKNVGEKKHYFTAPAFYKAIATRKVQSNKDGEIKAPYFTAIELMVGGQLDLYFVPVTKGEYPVYCTIDDHREQGMEGKLTIR
jgi:uncharacterized cupredoxin-like copper-binding protein